VPGPVVHRHARLVARVRADDDVRVPVALDVGGGDVDAVAGGSCERTEREERLARPVEEVDLGRASGPLPGNVLRAAVAVEVAGGDADAVRERRPVGGKGRLVVPGAREHRDVRVVVRTVADHDVRLPVPGHVTDRERLARAYAGHREERAAGRGQGLDPGAGPRICRDDEIGLAVPAHVTDRDPQAVGIRRRTDEREDVGHERACRAVENPQLRSLARLRDRSDVRPAVPVEVARGDADAVRDRARVEGEETAERRRIAGPCARPDGDPRLGPGAIGRDDLGAAVSVDVSRPDADAVASALGGVERADLPSRAAVDHLDVGAAPVVVAEDVVEPAVPVHVAERERVAAVEPVDVERAFPRADTVEGAHIGAPAPAGDGDDVRVPVSSHVTDGHVHSALREVVVGQPAVQPAAVRRCEALPRVVGREVRPAARVDPDHERCRLRRELRVRRSGPDPKERDRRADEDADPEKPELHARLLLRGPTLGRRCQQAEWGP
jgi:hypothetical protein